MNGFIDLKEIIYVPTLKCNYTCVHCGQDQSYQEKEVPAMELYKKLKECPDIVKGINLNITGGEPFVKKDIIDLILCIVNDPDLEIRVSITTNGYYTEKIQQLIDGIKKENKSKLSFAVSIDGPENTHNMIRGNTKAYKRAIETIKVILNAGIWTGVNTVLQRDNIEKVDELKRDLLRVGKGGIVHSCIPLIASISNYEDFVFNETEIKTILKYITTKRDKKYLLSKGKLNIDECHAGEKNICIGPALEVYTCLTGFSYIAEKREDYWLGDLKEEKLDTLMNRIAMTERVFAVKQCKGCNNPCEVIREEQFFDLAYDMEEKEVALGFGFYNIDGVMFDYHWHEKDEFENGDYLVWMDTSKGRKASFFFKPSVGHQKIRLWILNSMPYSYYHRNMECLIQVGSTIKEVECQDGYNLIEFEIQDWQRNYIRADILCRDSWVPSDVFADSNDARALGIALKKIEWI